VTTPTALLNDLEQAGQRLRVNTSTVRGLIARGELGPVVRIGRRVLIEERVLHAFIRSRRDDGATPKPSTDEPA
jgi:excisionase family DNA binding protein